MKKLVFLFTFALAFVFLLPQKAEAQSSFQPYGGITTDLNLYTGMEYGGLVGLAYKDRIYLNGMYRRSLRGQNILGTGLTWIANPEDYSQVGFTINLLAYSSGPNTGNFRYSTIEASLDRYWLLSDNVKAVLGIGFMGGLPSIQGRLIMGNFTPKYWRRYWIDKKIDRMMKTDSGGYIKSRFSSK